MEVKRVDVTPEACEIIEKLKKEHGELLFNQSGGCCDGTAPMCYAKDDFYVPSRNVKLGEICGCEFFIDKDQFEYFKHSHITIDVKKETAFGNSFSLEIDLGYQFLTISRIFTDEEYRNLEDAK
ncbi:DUF779 domain-containing protein [Malaciobacter marinus]|uniref:DUF779 domain-containing protein n=1 Tax=Malaciobacter marinus TaxID=505249 RepID=A0A347TNJ0_9BACT|nr:DUF779 domain-containing protein [Malaciobacter marinus]AXX88168.1 DUF779 domain-containing protein [Malaciobacter marinus]PHO15102.1 UDP-glucose 4-epimerase [Malaciobacter marinus]